MDNVRVLPRTTADSASYYAQNMVGLAERVTEHLAAPGPDLPREEAVACARRKGRDRHRRDRAPHGVCPDNDRPGIMLASAARTYLNHLWRGGRPKCRRGSYTANDACLCGGASTSTRRA